MDGNCQQQVKYCRFSGFTLTEIICAMGIVGVIVLTTSANFTQSSNHIKRLKVKNYLLQIRTIQANSLLKTGTYLPLSALPVLDIQGVSINVNTHLEAGYSFTLHQGFEAENKPCKTLEVNHLGLFPELCWH